MAGISTMDETSELLRSAVSRFRFCVASSQPRGVKLGHEVTKTDFIYLEVRAIGSRYDLALRGKPYPVGVPSMVPTYMIYDLGKLQVQGAA